MRQFLKIDLRILFAECLPRKAKNAKRANLLIKVEKLSSNMEFLRIFRVLKMTFKEVFGEHWELLFLRVQYQFLADSKTKPPPTQPLKLSFPR